MSSVETTSKKSLINSAKEVFLGFLRLGFTGFGGPLALIAQMQRDFIEERKWIPPDEFQKAFTLIKAMPGAVAFNMAVYLGRRRGGYVGGFLAGVGLIGPAFVAIILFSSSYSRIHSLPMLSKVLTGMQAAALALILAALKPLAGPYLRQIGFWILVVVSAVVFALKGLSEPILILSFGGAYALWRHQIRQRRVASGAKVLILAGASSEILAKLFWICFKAGAFVFGTGIAIAPMLERDFVHDLGWLTHAEFMDGLAIGQITPGPVLLTTTFLGHKVAGLPGALVATTGVFLAGFFHMMTWFPPAVNALSRQRWIEDFLFGALAVVVGTILVTIGVLGSEWTDHPVIYAMVVFGVFLSWKTKAPSWAIVLVGAIFGLVLA